MESNTLHEEIQATVVAEGSVALWWIGQAGYALKSPGGTVVLIDAYLTNVVQDLFGTSRLFPAPLDPTTARPDIIFATHWHEDHLDPAAIRPFAEQSQVIFVGPPSVAARVRGAGVHPERVITLERGQTVDIRDVRVTGTFARHEVPGFLTEDALGLLLTIAGVRIYHGGDSEYDARLRSIATAHPHVAMLPMNGSGGNMNAYEAALLAWQIAPRAVYPMHIGMWAPEGYGLGATLDPALFAETYRRLGGTGEVRVPALGTLEVLYAHD